MFFILLHVLFVCIISEYQRKRILIYSKIFREYSVDVLTQKHLSDHVCDITSHWMKFSSCFENLNLTTFASYERNAEDERPIALNGQKLCCFVKDFCYIVGILLIYH